MGLCRKVAIVGGQGVMLGVLAYVLYVLPVVSFVHWGYGRVCPWPLALGVSIGIGALLLLYFKTKLTTWWLKALVFTGIGLGYLLAVPTLLGHVVVRVYPVDTGQLAWVVLAVGGGLSGVAWVQGRVVRQRTLTLTSAKLTRTHRYVFISDIHVGTRSVRHLAAVLARCVALAPEAILIGGDLIDSSAVTMAHLRAFKAIDLPIYFVTGNHEYYLKQHQALLSQLDQVGVQWLDNAAVLHDNVQLIGIGDGQSAQAQIAHLERLMAAQPSHFSLALIHQPRCFDVMSTPPDLMLCGHTHNGQLFPFGGLVKRQFPRIYGRYTHPAGPTLYVSSGAGTWGTSLRLGSVNEVVLLELVP